MGTGFGRLPLCVIGAAASPAVRAVGAVAAVAVLLACAGDAPKGPTVISSIDEEVDFDEPRKRTTISPSGPVQLPYRAPPKGGSAYRIVLEISGDWHVTDPGEPEGAPLSESHLLELEYREIPTQGTGDGRSAYLLELDALHYELLQQNPPARREIELGQNRLRVHSDGNEVMDLRGAQPKADLTPHKLLGHIFGVVVHDEFGNPVAIAPRGVPPARTFLSSLYVKEAIGYSRVSLPQAEITPGATWRALRFPASRSGALGMAMEVEYSLAAYEQVDGVPCALILLRAQAEGQDVTSETGLLFDRVLAKLSGSAWVELETSRVRRLVLEDEVRVALHRGKPPIVQSTRMRHATRLLLEARDPESTRETWADGSSRFGKR